MSVRLFYVDDSGATDTRTVVFGWLELDATAWSATLRRWLDFRNELQRGLGIPTDYELHGTRFVGGRGRPTGTDWDLHKSYRADVVSSALATIAETPGVDVGAVYACATGRSDFHDLKARTYARLVRMIDDRLTTAGELGLIVMDGDGTDPTYRAAHRELKLATRSLIEDPFFHGSHHSQWMMMSDLVAYAAYMHVAQLPTKEATWNWYRDILGGAVTGPTPLRLDMPPKES